MDVIFKVKCKRCHIEVRTTVKDVGYDDTMRSLIPITTHKELCEKCLSERKEHVDSLEQFKQKVMTAFYNGKTWLASEPEFWEKAPKEKHHYTPELFELRERIRNAKPGTGIEVDDINDVPNVIYKESQE